MGENNKGVTDRSDQSAAVERQRPIFVTILTVLLLLSAVAAVAWGVLAATNTEEGAPNSLQILLAGIILAGFFTLLARGMWKLQDWARTAVILLLLLVGLYFSMSVVFDLAAEIFGGEQVVPLGDILLTTLKGLLRVAATGAIPIGIIYLLMRQSPEFEETLEQRNFVDKGIRYLLIATALSAVFVVFLIILFTLIEAWPSLEEIGLDTMLLGTIWRPGSIIGTDKAQFGLLPMIVGSILSTFGAVVIGVPLSIGTAILLAEVAPPLVREIVRPAVELLAGIPSVVYGLFGMVVLAPLIRNWEVPYNTGFGVINASFILAVMIMPTVTNIAEDAIRAVPRIYKEGALALGSTHWQTIWSVILPAARSGLVAAVILGIGRALGETMAVIMVSGNSIAFPQPLNDNPLTIILSSFRSLTGNVAVEINYAAGAHRSALFFTGVLLFLMILLINTLARYLMRERLSS